MSLRLKRPNIGAIGLAAAFQRVRQQFDPVLSPEHLAVEHIDRRTEHVGGDRILPVLFIGRADVVGGRALDQLVAGKPRVVGKLRNGVGIGKIELLLPHRRICAPQIGIGIEPGLDGRDHHAIGKPRIERHMFGPEMEIQPALVAPALQLHHPIALPHRMTLDQRQAAGLGEQLDQHHRLVVDLQTVGRDDVAEGLVADIGPWRGEREIVVDLAGHAVSGRTEREACCHPNRAPDGLQARSLWT